MNRRAASLVAGILLTHAGASCAEVADRDKPVYLESDRVAIDDIKRTSVFEGRVQFKQGTLVIKAEKIVVTEDRLGFQHCVANGELASFSQKQEGSEEYLEGFAEHIEYDARMETIDLFGRARVKRNTDDVQGDHISYSTRTEVFRVVGSQEATGSATDGRVRAVLQPRDKDTENAPATGKDPLTIKPSTTLSNQP